MNIERLKRDGDALVDLFNGQTKVVIDYLFILLINCVCFYLSFDFGCVIVAETLPAPPAVLLVPYVNSVNREVLWRKELPVDVPTILSEFSTDT